MHYLVAPKGCGADNITSHNNIQYTYTTSKSGLSELGGRGVFGRSINPISTRGANYTHHITRCPRPPDFHTFLRPCRFICKIDCNYRVFKVIYLDQISFYTFITLTHFIWHSFYIFVTIFTFINKFKLHNRM